MARRSFLLDCGQQPLAASVVLFGASVGTATWLLLRSRRTHQKHKSEGEVSVADLLDPHKRASHLDWNAQLLARFPEGIVKVAGCSNLYIVLKHGTALQLSQDHRLSPNPYEDERLVALSTMPAHRHAVVSKILHKYYQPREMRRLEQDFYATIANYAHASTDGDEFCVMTWAKRVHMSNTLKVVLGDDASESTNLVDEFVQYSDDMVKLVAPLGGVGRPCPSFFSMSTVRLILGLFKALPHLLKFFREAGVWAGLAITRPDKTLGRSDSGSGVWHHPELLAQVPRYFSSLMRLWNHVPLPLEVAKSPMQALKFAVANGEVSLAEALETLAQLMVNMTSANALGNLVWRLCTERRPSCDPSDLEAFVAEVLRLDVPLQRNPRRVLEAFEVDGVTLPKGASVLLFLGAANVDPDHFESPMTFRPGRKEHLLTFGVGLHYCLGVHLVKVEMREALRYMLQTYSSLRIVGYERVATVDVGNYGFESLRVKVEDYEAAI
eukprot:TRINITY_DN5590_c0_g1_i1.p1 TRINITY_DN5590_c0_g1~~TRINITY_DN5590_c0_g1_i1.p1  ORF type:complete len:509 (+),score=64.04 TRINITY_DN5590_c0_g1_i1:43-1527(+)